jgi:hypothetical protein
VRSLVHVLSLVSKRSFLSNSKSALRLELLRTVRFYEVLRIETFLIFHADASASDQRLRASIPRNFLRNVTLHSYPVRLLVIILIFLSVSMKPLSSRFLSLLLWTHCAYATALSQKPLISTDSPDIPSLSGTSYWKFNFSSPAPHYFASMYGLLQQWSNTFFPNGHSIVPCEIPAFTKLYHGRIDGNLPPSPEWVAFDM